MPPVDSAQDGTQKSSSQRCLMDTPGQSDATDFSSRMVFSWAPSPPASSSDSITTVVGSDPPAEVTALPCARASAEVPESRRLRRARFSLRRLLGLPSHAGSLAKMRLFFSGIALTVLHWRHACCEGCSLLLQLSACRRFSLIDYQPIPYIITTSAVTIGAT